MGRSVLRETMRKLFSYEVSLRNPWGLLGPAAHRLDPCHLARGRRYSPSTPNDRRTVRACPPLGPKKNRACAVPSNASLAESSCSFTRPRPPLSGWSAIERHVALTYTASIIVGLAAQQAGRPDLIRSPKRVLAHCWEAL
jgi:hypothetical protein